MAKLESSFKNMVIVLTGIALFAAFALGSVYTLTKEPIAASQKAKQDNAIKEVLPEGFDAVSDPVSISIDGMTEPFIVYNATKGGEFLGAAVQTYSNNGFSGTIRIMVGFDASGNIVNYAVLEQKETPGLGTKMVNWFKSDKVDVRGMNGATNNLTVSKDGGDVDAITAATISSRAFLESVRFAYQAYVQDTAEKTSTAQAEDMSNENTAAEVGSSAAQEEGGLR